MQINSKALVKLLLGQEAKVYKDILEPLGKKTGRKYTEDNFSQRLNRGSFKYDEMLALCDILGYDIEVKKRKNT